jgi:hypothetical protein
MVNEGTVIGGNRHEGKPKAKLTISQDQPVCRQPVSNLQSILHTILLSILQSILQFNSAIRPELNLVPSRNKLSASQPYQRTILISSNWTAWIPFCLLAYRTRVHSSSKFTPYELMFGRKINDFSRWENNSLEEEAFNSKRNMKMIFQNL